MLYPLMLLGMLGLSVPILIHLINRRRVKPQLLATVTFLDQQDVANTFAPVPRDLPQLLLRLALIGLFVLLMARMTGSSPTVGPRAVAIVLDNSLSMRRLIPDKDERNLSEEERKKRARKSLFDLHRERILELVRGMRQGDFFSFTLVGEKVFTSTGFTSDREAIEKAVAEAWVSDGGGRGVYTAIEDNLKELRSRRAPNTVLIVFSDQQLRNYRSRLDTPGLTDLLAGSVVKPVFVQDPMETGPNIELRGAEFHPERIHLGAGGKVTARLRNGSDVPLTTSVDLKSGETTIESRTCDLAGGETAHVEVRNVFESQNDTAWRVSLSEDGFSADNDLYTTVRMLRPRDVLLVTSPDYPAPEGMTIGNTGADLFACALNPSQVLGTEGGTYIRVKRIGIEDFEQRALSLHTLIVFYGVQEMPRATEAKRDLEAYVRNGGGVYLIPDAKTNPALFNETFAPLLAGFKLGALLEPANPVPLDGDEKHLAHPLFRKLWRGEWGTHSDILFARWFLTEQAGNTRAVLKTGDGHTLIAVAERGRGRVCIQTHSWNIQDTTLPRSLPYVPLIHALVDHLSRAEQEAAEPPDRIQVGAFHRMSLPIDFRGLAAVDLEGPRTCAFDMAPETSQLTIQDMYVAGAYRVKHPSKIVKDRWLAVNRDLAESEAAFMTAEQLGKLCGGRDDAVVRSDRLEDLFHPRREWYPLLMALVLIALAVEGLGPLLWRRKNAHAMEGNR